MKKNMPLILAAAACICSLLLMCAALFCSGGEKESPEFVPPEFEIQAVTGVPNVPEDIGWGELDAGAYRVSVCGQISLMEDQADIWLYNMETNEVWLKLRMLDPDGEVLGETGLIRPGEYVKTMKLKTIPEDGSEVRLKIMGYEPESYYSAGSAVLKTVITKGE